MSEFFERTTTPQENITQSEDTLLEENQPNQAKTLEIKRALRAEFMNLVLKDKITAIEDKILDIETTPEENLEYTSETKAEILEFLQNLLLNTLYEIDQKKGAQYFESFHKLPNTSEPIEKTTLEESQNVERILTDFKEQNLSFVTYEFLKDYIKIRIQKLSSWSKPFKKKTELFSNIKNHIQMLKQSAEFFQQKMSETYTQTIEELRNKQDENGHFIGMTYPLTFSAQRTQDMLTVDENIKNQVTKKNLQDPNADKIKAIGESVETNMAIHTAWANKSKVCLVAKFPSFSHADIYWQYGHTDLVVYCFRDESIDDTTKQKIRANLAKYLGLEISETFSPTPIKRGNEISSEEIQELEQNIIERRLQIKGSYPALEKASLDYPPYPYTPENLQIQDNTPNNTYNPSGEIHHNHPGYLCLNGKNKNETKEERDTNVQQAINFLIINSRL